MINNITEVPVSEKEILKWSAGSQTIIDRFAAIDDRRLTAILGIDEHSLIDNIFQHRLVQRTLIRYTNELPGWINIYILQQLSRFYHESQERIGKQIRAIKEIQSALPSNNPLIILKGISAYGLTGDISFVRHSNDVDVCYINPEELWNTMVNLGYKGKRHYDYEFAKMEKDGITFDIHNYYPILSYPDGITSISPNSIKNTTNFRCISGSDYPKEKRFSYGSMVSCSREGFAAGLSGINFLNIEALVMMQCAHTFKNFIIQPHYMTSSRQIRLGELADIATLSSLDHFDMNAFQKLVSENTAQDAVDFVSNALLTYEIPHRPLSVSNEVENRAYPENLFCGGWVNLDTPNEWLFPRTMTSIVGILNAKSYITLPYREEDRFYNLGEFHQVPTQNIFTLSYSSFVGASEENPPIFSFKILPIKNSDSLRISLAIPENIRDACIEFHAGGDYKVQAVIKNQFLDSFHYRKDVFPHPPLEEDSFSSRGGYALITISFPIEIFDDAMGDLPLLFAISHNCGECQDIDKYVHYIPIILNQTTSADTDHQAHQ